MDNEEQISPFDLALAAFRIRFARDLTSSWESAEAATIKPLSDAAPEAKQNILRRCFEDAAEKIAAVVHSYFPRLLAVATKQRPCWVGQQITPISWTATRIREQTCYFLGMDADENFENTATPRADSQVIQATREILYLARCLPENSADEFSLPWWADHGLLTGYWLGFGSLLGPTAEPCPFSPPSGDDSECISHAESLAWIREREVEIRNRLGRQIEDEIFDAMIAEGATADSALPRSVTGATTDPESRFEKEGNIWTIAFAGETCRLPASLIGLDYISVLLKYAGTSIGAQEIRAMRAAVAPYSPETLRELRSDPVSDEESVLQTDFSSYPVLDVKARADYLNAIKDLDERIMFAKDTGNIGAVGTLEEEKKFIQSELINQAGLLGRPRRFANQKESARTTVTHAIKLAFEKIEKTAPATGQYLRDNIETGAFLTYRDCSVRWKT